MVLALSLDASAVALAQAVAKVPRAGIADRVIE